MSEQAYSRRQVRKTGSNQKYKEYKGRSPFLSDRFVEWLLKMIFQVILFTAFYHVLSSDLYSQYENDVVGFFVANAGLVLLLLLLSDFIAHVIGYLGKAIYLKYKRYVSSKKKNNNLGRWLWEYIIYTLLRAFFYIIQLVTLFATVLQPVLSVLSTFTAWIIVSLIAIVVARILSTYIISK